MSLGDIASEKRILRANLRRVFSSLFGSTGLCSRKLLFSLGNLGIVGPRCWSQSALWLFHRAFRSEGPWQRSVIQGGSTGEYHSYTEWKNAKGKELLLAPSCCEHQPAACQKRLLCRQWPDQLYKTKKYKHQRTACVQYMCPPSLYIYILCCS